MVKYARSQGVHVIVTDNLPLEKSVAKQIADESWMISTADVETIVKAALEHKVDGVFAGVSEFNLEKAMTVAGRLGLPFYCTREQWDIASNKARFKELCRTHNIPVSKDFNFDWNLDAADLEDVRYPLIIKPVDSSSCKGISVCYNESQLKVAVEKALSNSQSEEIIVEEFIGGDEISVHYTLKDGEISLSCMMDKYLSTEIGPLPVPEVYLYPSKHLESYIVTLDDAVKEMFRNAGFKNGTVFLQGKVNPNGFVFFEMGYRLSGTAVYHFTSKLNGINSMEMYVNHALTGTMNGYDLSLDNPKFNRTCCNLSIFIDEGVIGRINGLDDVLGLENIVNSHQSYSVGDSVPKTGTLQQIFIRLFIIADSNEDLCETVEIIHNSLQVLDVNGRNMLHRPIDIRSVCL
jgi:carbamoylphosphate synthase large subunit